MDVERVLIDCWNLILKHGATPTVAMTSRMAREMGAKVRNDIAYRVLPPQSSDDAGRARESKSLTWGEVGRVRGERGRATVVADRLPDAGDLSLLAAMSSGVKPVTIAEYRSAVEKRVGALGDREIRSLDHREMFDVAALHALRFMGRKAATEEKARRIAIGLVSRIRRVATAPEKPAMHTLTVREYFGFGREIWEAGGKQEWDLPWAVVAWAEAPERAK